jgi:hypothetical protein
MLKSKHVVKNIKYHVLQLRFIVRSLFLISQFNIFYWSVQALEKYFILLVESFSHLVNHATNKNT